METDKAINLLQEHASVSVRLTHASNEGRNAPRLVSQHLKTTRALLTALIGREPTDDEVERASVR